MNASEHMEQAFEHDRKAEESFGRCDTDGFVSQWAHGVMSAKHRLQAELDEAGGLAEFDTLMQGDRKVDAKLVAGQFGTVWLLAEEEEDRFGRKFVPFSDTGRSRVQKSLGLHQSTEMAPGVVVMSGSGTGLGGAASVRPIIIRTTR